MKAAVGLLKFWLSRYGELDRLHMFEKMFIIQKKLWILEKFTFLLVAGYEFGTHAFLSILPFSEKDLLIILIAEHSHLQFKIHDIF